MSHKKLYFIRHGESSGNSGDFRQTATTPLSETGRIQAAKLSNVISKFGIQVIVSSTMLRAKETTELVLEENPLPVIYHDLFIERRLASVALGRLKTDPEAIRAWRIIKKNYSKPRFRYSDEENFEDIKERVKKGIELLISLPFETVAIITHEFFMRMILAYIVFGDSMRGKDAEKIIYTFKMDNTGVSLFEFNDKSLEWSICTWNEHSHLDKL